MASLTDFTENLVAKWLLSADTATRPTAWHLALFTAAPGDAGGGTEVSGGGYARQSVTFSVTGDAGSNTNALNFTASGANFGDISHGAIFDAATAGNMLCWTAFPTTTTINDGASLVVDVGNLVVRFA